MYVVIAIICLQIYTYKYNTKTVQNRMAKLKWKLENISDSIGRRGIKKIHMTQSAAATMSELITNGNKQGLVQQPTTDHMDYISNDNSDQSPSTSSLPQLSRFSTQGKNQQSLTLVISQPSLYLLGYSNSMQRLGDPTINRIVGYSCRFYQSVRKWHGISLFHTQFCS